jgi:ribosomal 30S subunit maturation factor RimM
MVGAEVRHVWELNPDQSQSRLVWVSDEDCEVRTQVAEALEVPTVVITECPDASTRNQARTLGGCRVLAKPLQLEAVWLAVRQLAG